MSAAVEPLTIRKTVPPELLKTEGGLSPNMLMFLVSAGLIGLSTAGYFFMVMARLVRLLHECAGASPVWHRHSRCFP